MSLQLEADLKELQRKVESSRAEMTRLECDMAPNEVEKRRERGKGKGGGREKGKERETDTGGRERVTA